METKTHNKTRVVAHDALDCEIQRASHKLARKNHLDVASDPQTEAKFQDVNEDCDVLKDPERRAKYGNPQPRYEVSGSPNWDGGFWFALHSASSAGGFDDIFRSLWRSDPHTSGFGGRMSMAGQHACIEVSSYDPFSRVTRTLTQRMPHVNTNRDVSVVEPNGWIRRLTGKSLSTKPPGDICATPQIANPKVSAELE